MWDIRVIDAIWRSFPWNQFRVLWRFLMLVSRNFLHKVVEYLKVWKMHKFSVHSVETTENHCHFFDENFVKATFLLKKLVKRWFDEIFFRWEYIFHFTTLCTRLNSAEEIRFEEFYVQSVITINWWNPRRIFWRFSINIQSISRKNYQSKPQNSPKSKILLQNFVKGTRIVWVFG